MKKYIVMILSLFFACADISLAATELTASNEPHHLSDGAYHEACIHDEYAEDVLFDVDKPVRQFRIFSAEFDVTEDGKLVLAKEETLYLLPKLSPEKPVFAMFQIYGTIPNMGVRFIEEDGTVVQYAISSSGEDGSIVLSPIEK